MWGFVAKTMMLWIAILFCVYEGSRFYMAHHECTLRFESNERFMAMKGVCDALPHMSSPEIHARCLSAEVENRMWLSTCALRRMWASSEWVRVWSMFTESYVMLLGCTAFLFAAVAYIGVSLHTARQQRNMQQEFLKTFQPMMLPAPPTAAALEWQDDVGRRRKTTRFSVNRRGPLSIDDR